MHKRINEKAPIFQWRLFSAVRTGLEPATPCVTGMYSNQLNYRTTTLLSCSFNTNDIEGLQM